MFSTTSLAELSAEASTYVVISGILSFTSISVISLLLMFLTKIVYVISSPLVTTFFPELVTDCFEISMSLLSFTLNLLDISIAFNPIGVQPT